MRIVKPQVINSTEHGESVPYSHDLKQVLEQTGEAVIVKDMNAVVSFWNR